MKMTIMMCEHDSWLQFAERQNHDKVVVGLKGNNNVFIKITLLRT